MKIRMFQVDSFTDTLFGGNPAAVCLLESWLDDTRMQLVAMENNLAETAFVVRHGDGYAIRWFTPTVEVDLCGHATLAAAHVIFNHLEYSRAVIHFYSSRSGLLRVSREGSFLVLDFPADPPEPVPVSESVCRALGAIPVATLRGSTDLMAVFESETDVLRLVPDMNAVADLPCRGVIATAPGATCDFVSRFFAPQSGISEDPVTGSAHTTLTPYWSAMLHKSELSAIQVSPRQGRLHCRNLGDRVEIAGQAVTYLSGEIDTGLSKKLF